MKKIVDSTIDEESGDWHILPVNDTKTHKQSVYCECSPEVRCVGGTNIVVHNSYDGREAIEQVNEILNNKSKMAKRSITFDQQAQENLPQHIKDKMKKHREEAEAKSKVYNVIIAGGRDFSDEDFIYSNLDAIFKDYKHKLCIFSGMADGVDSIGLQWAKDRGHAYREFPADWSKHGRAGGPIRNQLMADEADGLIAFFRDTSGTADMIDKATKKGLRVKIINY